MCFQEGGVCGGGVPRLFVSLSCCEGANVILSCCVQHSSRLLLLAGSRSGF